MEFGVLGWNLLIDVHEKETEIKNDMGIIIAADKSQHILMSGTVVDVGNKAKEDTEGTKFGKGSVVYFYDMELMRIRLNNKEYGVIHLDKVKAFENRKIGI